MLSNLLVLNFEKVSWNYTLPPDRPESLSTVRDFLGAQQRPKTRSYVRAQKIARGVNVDKIIAPTISAPSFSCLFNKSTSELPFHKRRTSRVSSAPPNVTRQVNQSIEQHIQRLYLAQKHTVPPYIKQQKVRPKSSPSHLWTCTSKGQGKHDVSASDTSTCMKHDAEVTEKFDSLSMPSKHNLHGINRRQSVTSIRTRTLPITGPGWTTSGENLISPHNKLMPTASQARERFKRPQSADSTRLMNGLTKVENTGSRRLRCASNFISATTSCLNLKTLEEEQRTVNIERKQLPTKRQRNSILHRPQTCLT